MSFSQKTHYAQRPGLGDEAVVRVTSARTEAESSAKDDILQLARLYSSAGYAAE